MRIWLDPDPKHWRTLIQTVRQWELEKHLEKYHGCAPSTPVLFLDYAHQQDPLLEVREVRILFVFFIEDSFYSKSVSLFLVSYSFTLAKKTLISSVEDPESFTFAKNAKNWTPKKKKQKNFMI
jgi:hypothetical protein